jgi:DNA excision repair protein ERCC-8
MAADVKQQSLFVALQQRNVGTIVPQGFRNRVASYHSSHISLLDHPEIVSSHTSGMSLCMDKSEYRYLLSGGLDAVLSIYDLSPWGHERHDQQPHLHKAVAQSIRVPASSNRGHASSIVAAQWHPVDTGAFVSAAKDGTVLVWDTNSMRPVVKWNPMKTLSCLSLSTSLQRSESLMAIGSCHVDEPIVKLLDIRSGGASHSLLGHNKGITHIQWSPTCDVILLSGGMDGTIRVWDIRKSGSRACLAILNRDTPELNKSRQYRGDYSHLVMKKKTVKVGPNNYHLVEDTSISSHSGPISGLAFSEDGHNVVSTAQDAKLKVWDMRTNANWMPLHFHGHGGRSPIMASNPNVPILVQNYGRQSIAWVGLGNSIMGYDIHMGGMPIHHLQGHLDSITCLECLDHSFGFISGGMDGMILSWGRPFIHTCSDPTRSISSFGTRYRNSM